MAAMVAGVAFAADVAAKIKVDGSLFNYSNDSLADVKLNSTTVSGLKVTRGGESWNPMIQFSFAGEKAGAYIRANDTGDNTAVLFNNSNVWFKPVEALKVTTGYWESNLNNSTIDWNTASGCSGAGYVATIATNGFSFDAAILPGWGKSWFSKTTDGDTVLGQSFLKVAYGADFGTVSAMVNFNSAANTTKMGAAFSSKAGPVSYFVNFLGYDVSGEFTSIRVEPFAAFGQDALTVKAWLPVDYNLKADKDNLAIQTTVNVSYAMGSVTPFFYFNCGNLLADKLSMTFKPGVDGSVGEMGYGVACAINYDASEPVTGMSNRSAITVDVPVYFVINF